MRCLCCGKELSINSTDQELETQWHTSCVKRFFGTSILPEINISKDTLSVLAKESTNKGLTVPGVQKKLSLHLSLEDKSSPRLTLINYPTGYILKPQTEEYKYLPECEFLVMSMAKITNINTVPFALIHTSLLDNELAYITKRIDRLQINNQIKMLAMEDFCQLENRLTIDKYKSSYESCAKIIEKYCENIGLDMSELFLRVVFSFVIGNSDMHLKNFSLIETEEGSEIYSLSQAYDMLPVNLILPEDKEQLALTLNGKKNNIRYKDFLIFADKCKLNKKSAEKMITKVVSMKDTYIKMCQESYLPKEMKSSFEQLITQRISIFAK